MPVVRLVAKLRVGERDEDERSRTPSPSQTGRPAPRRPSPDVVATASPPGRRRARPGPRARCRRACLRRRSRGRAGSGRAGRGTEPRRRGRAGLPGREGTADAMWDRGHEVDTRGAAKAPTILVGLPTMSRARRLLWRRSATAVGLYTSVALGLLGAVVAARELGERDSATTRRSSRQRGSSSRCST